MASRALSDRLLLATALAGAVVFYAAAWSAVPATDGDSAGYVEVANDLADGRLDRLYWRPVGYPLLLLLTGPQGTPGPALVIVQLLLHAAAVALCAGLLRRAGAGRLATGGFVGVALLPPFVEHAAFVLSETLTQFGVVLACVGLARWLLGGGVGWIVAAGLACGATAVVRPSEQLLFLLLPGLALAWSVLVPAGPFAVRRAIGAAAIVAALTAPLLGGAIAFNAARFDYAGLSPMLGVTLSHKTSRVVERLPAEFDDVREILLRHRDAALLDPVTGHLGLAYIFRALPELEAKTGLHGPELTTYLVGMNLALMRRAPMDYVDEVLRSAVWYWSPGVTDLSGFGSGALKAGWNGVRAIVLLAFFGSVLLLAGPAVMFGAALRQRSMPSSRTDGTLILDGLFVLFLCLGTIAFSCLVSIALTAAVYRLRIPVDLLILVCVALFPGLWVDLRGALLGPLKRAAPTPDAPTCLP